MKRLLLALLLIAGASLPAYSQGSPICYTTNGSNCVKVGIPGFSAYGPLPVTGTVTITPSGVQNINLTQILGAAPSLTNPLWVFPATGATFTVSVNNFTGSALQTASIPTIQAAAYSAGNCIGGFNAVTVTDNNGQSGFVTNFRAVSLAAATPTLTIYLFDSQPTTSTCNDKGIFSLSAADIDRLIAAPSSITLAAPSNVTSPSNASLDFTPPRPFRAGGSTASGVKTIYYGIVTSAVTPSSVSDLHLRIGTALN